MSNYFSLKTVRQLSTQSLLDMLNGKGDFKQRAIEGMDFSRVKRELTRRNKTQLAKNKLTGGNKMTL